MGPLYLQISPIAATILATPGISTPRWVIFMCLARCYRTRGTNKKKPPSHPSSSPSLLRGLPSGSITHSDSFSPYVDENGAKNRLGNRYAELINWLISYGTDIVNVWLGANRGIGLSVLRELSRRKWNVVGTIRPASKNDESVNDVSGPTPSHLLEGC